MSPRPISSVPRHDITGEEVGPLASLLAEIRQHETRREHLTAQFQTVAGAVKLAALDHASVRQNLRERLTDWQGLRERETVEARPDPSRSAGRATHLHAADDLVRS